MSEDSTEPEILPPDYFSAVGIDPFKPEHVKPIADRFKLFGLDLKTTPWVVLEFVALCKNEFHVELEHGVMRETLAISASLSRVFIPSPPDPDVPETPQFPHPFRIGECLDKSLIIGVTTDAFKQAYEAEKLCYFEIHLWVKSRDGRHVRSSFVWTILRKDGDALCIAAVGDKPLIIPIDESRKWRCQYAIANNIGPKFA